MNYTVKSLTAELANTFVDYLSSIGFEHEPHWATCFCRFYYSNCSFTEWANRSGETNKNEALFEINGGRMNGYLAFDGDKCIGWCNTSDVSHFERLKDEIMPYCKDKKVGGTVCFVIHPDYRGKGVARLILEKAISDFKEKGYEAMIAMPFEDKESPQKQYRGTKNMYIQNGYKELDRKAEVSVMWLEF